MVESIYRFRDKKYKAVIMSTRLYVFFMGSVSIFSMLRSSVKAYKPAYRELLNSRDSDEGE